MHLFLVLLWATFGILTASFRPENLETGNWFYFLVPFLILSGVIITMYTYKHIEEQKGWDWDSE